MGLFPTGVTLLTTRAPDGADHAITANSFTSVSLEPLLRAGQRRARLPAARRRAGVGVLWAVSVLGADAERLSRRFARRGHSTLETLARVPHHRGRHTGALLLDEALTVVECRTWAAHPGGDHTVLIGEVLSLGYAAPGCPAAGLAPRRLRSPRPQPAERG